jgi:putative oxidoreductase
MKTALKILTALFGLFWLVFGLNNFLHFFPVPEPSKAGADFMQALENAGYVLPIVYVAQIVAGLMLLIRRFLPLALLLLAPVIVNILLYDIFLNPSGLVIGGVIGALYATLLFDHRYKFTPLLTP